MFRITTKVSNLIAKLNRTSLIGGFRNINVQSQRVTSVTDIPQIPGCEFEFEKYEGPSYEKINETHASKLSPTLVPYYSKPVLATQGRMQWIWDESGKRYLDLFAGIVTVSVGHCHPKVSEAARKQLDRLWHTTTIYLTPPIHEYAEKLAETLPGDLNVCFFVNSGSEANDLAMLLARVYSGNFDILSFRNAYHGTSPYTIGLTAHGTWKHNYATGFGIHHIMNPDPYQGLWGGARCRDSPVQTERTCSCAEGYCKASDEYIDQLQEVLDYSVPKKIAGMFAESIQGVGGTVQFPKGYLKRAFEMVRERGGVCISDEVQTGFGRLGSHMWGFETHGVVPDIVTMAKGMGNGFPLAAVVTTPKIFNALKGVLHFNTFGGNPVSCAVGSSVLDVMKEEKMQENCDVIGTYFLEELAKLRDAYDVVGDVRGKGLMIGVELVEDKISKKALPPAEFMKIFDDVGKMGVLVGRGGYYLNVLRIKPPMCLTKEDVDFAVAVLRRAFHRYANGDLN